MGVSRVAEYFDLHGKIHEMYQYYTVSEIAKAIEIQEEIVAGVIDGRISADQLADCNPFDQRTELRLVVDNTVGDEIRRKVEEAAIKAIEAEKRAESIGKELKEVKKSDGKQTRGGFLKTIYKIALDLIYIALVMIALVIFSIVIYLANDYGLESGRYSHPMLAQAAGYVESLYDKAFELINNK